MPFDYGDELARRIFSPNPFEYGSELAERIFRPNPMDKAGSRKWLKEHLQDALSAGPSNKLLYSQLFDSLNSFDKETALDICKEILGMQYYMHVGTLSKLLNTSAGDLLQQVTPQEVTMQRRRRNPYPTRWNPEPKECIDCGEPMEKGSIEDRCHTCQLQRRTVEEDLRDIDYDDEDTGLPPLSRGLDPTGRNWWRNPMTRWNPAGIGNCPHCNAGLSQKHYNQNQCWRCKAQLSAGRSASIFGRAPRAALGVAARRRRFLRRRNPTDTSFFDHDAGVFGGPSWGRRRLRRFNPLWGWGQSAPSRLRRRLQRYRYNPGCESCGCDMCTCGTEKHYRYNPCDDCNGDPCTCGSHSAYFPNPATTRHWDPLDAPTARWKPGQEWAEAEPVEEQITDRFRRYRRN